MMISKVAMIDQRKVYTWCPKKFVHRLCYYCGEAVDSTISDSTLKYRINGGGLE